MPETRTTDPNRAAALQAAGARLVRHGHDMVLDLHGPPPTVRALPVGLRLASIAEALPGLGMAYFLAYPPGHPDAVTSREEAEQRCRDVLAGGPGPLLEPPSVVVVEASGHTVAAAVLVTRLDSQPWGWDGGPWVAELFVVPAHQSRGLGRLLLRRVTAWSHAAGEQRVGLTVTEGNPARQLYASEGFERRRTLFVFETA